MKNKADSDDELVSISKLKLIQKLIELQELNKILLNQNRFLNENQMVSQPTVIKKPLIQFKQPKKVDGVEDFPIVDKTRIQLKKKLLYQYADVKEWTYNSFPWDIEVKDILMKRFGNENFRPNQRAIVNCVLSRKDVFVCMHTGYGKSLTFQIPACVEKGISIVIMPLISLIFDQVTYLTSIGIKVENVCGQNRIPRFNELVSKDIRLIYTTPEKVEKSEQFKSLLQELYQHQMITRFVIDEAHCVSKWGRDFRPDYMKLSKVRDQFPNIPIIALTATAPEEVKEDVIKILQITNCLYLQSSFNRPNLIYQVRQRPKNDKAIQEIKIFIDSTYPKQCGIIYCLTQHECESTAQALSTAGVNSNHYHGGMNETDRNKVHQQWMMNEVQVIVATIAFGMGIDKKDCRYVIHYQMPKSIENYYQESGRAGRDTKLSHCILYYSTQDYKINLMLTDKSDLTPKMKKYNIDKLSQMEAFCNNLEDCRREMQLSYLGEIFDRINCNKTCDNCERQAIAFEYKDYTSECKRILEVLINYQLTEKQLITVLKGNSFQQKKGKGQRYINVELINGILKGNPDDINQIIHQLKQQNFIELKITNVGTAKYKNKCVYLTSNAKCLYQFKELKIKVFAKEEKKKSIEDKVTMELFGKYLHDNKKAGKQTTLTQFTKEHKHNGLIDEYVYDEFNGYCNAEQYKEIKERLMNERKRIYMDSQKSNDPLFNIELVLSDYAMEDLCRKLPTNQEEIFDKFIHIPEEIKKKGYMNDFLDEINHFIEFSDINKELFTIPEKYYLQNQIDQKEVFEFDKYIKIEENRESYGDESCIQIDNFDVRNDDLDPSELISSDDDGDLQQDCGGGKKNLTNEVYKQLLLQLNKDYDFILQLSQETPKIQGNNFKRKAI